MIQHIVLFNPKGSLLDTERRLYAQKTLDVLKASPHIVHFTIGRRVSVDPGYAREFGDKTYEYAAVLDFDDTSALIGYLTSPDHAELGRLFWEMCESTVVVEVEVASGSGRDAVDMLV